jgi:cytochrome-b5 reductase
LVLKIYPNGKMTNFVDGLKIGECINVRGPKGRFQYTKNMYKNIGMLAGGTGICPMLQIVILNS